MHTTVLSRGAEDTADRDLSVEWADWTDSDSRAFAHEIDTPTALDAAPGWRWLASRRVRRAGLAVLLLEVGLLIGFVAVYRPFDLNIYLWGGRAVTHGLRLYLVQADANWFTYPPFAATVFTPMAGMPGLLARLGWEIASVAALAFACVVTVRLAGYRPTRSVIVTMVAAALLLEPMYHTLYLGQVNLMLMALVLADVWRVSRGRPAGIGIGIAAAIKLVPGIFIVLLLVTRRTKDAAIAAGTFVGCGLIGYVVDPAASRLYWTRLFYDSKRVSAGYISNQSLYAAAVRILGGPSHAGAWFLLVAAVLGVVGLWVAAVLAGRNDWLGGSGRDRNDRSAGVADLVDAPLGLDLAGPCRARARRRPHSNRGGGRLPAVRPGAHVVDAAPGSPRYGRGRLPWPDDYCRQLLPDRRTVLPRLHDSAYLPHCDGRSVPVRRRRRSARRSPRASRT